MGQKKIHSNNKQIQKNASQTKQRKQGASKVSAKTSDMVRLRQAVYELAPMELHEYLKNSQDENLNSENEEEESIPEELLDLDSDLDLSDEDETPKEYESQLYDYTGYPTNKIDFQESVIFEPSTAYVIAITGSSSTGFRCRFEEPDWFFNFRQSNTGTFDYIIKLKRVIEEIALWFEATRQAFLSAPSPETYVIEDADLIQYPCVLQSGLADILNNRLPGYDIEKTIISRVKNKIWLLWDTFNMPFESIFLPEFRMAWVVEKCKPAYANNQIFLQQGLLYKDFTREDLKNAKMKRIEDLDPEQRLRILINKVNLGNQMIENVFNEICDKIGKSH